MSIHPGRSDQTTGMPGMAGSVRKVDDRLCLEYALSTFFDYSY
jgi:hypothetical protein